MTEKLLSLSDNVGKPTQNNVFEPDKLYGHALDDKPDLIVHFNNLAWRSAGTMRHRALGLSENDAGPDDSVHSMYGVFMFYNPRSNLRGKEIKGLQIQDFAPMLFEHFGVKFGDHQLDGRVVKEVLVFCG